MGQGGKVCMTGGEEAEKGSDPPPPPLLSVHDAAGRSDAEIMRFCQSFMTELQRHIGPDTDVPAGDMGVTAREIGYMYGQYRRIRGASAAVMTGKGPAWGGSALRPEATGYGAVFFAEHVLGDGGDCLRGKRCLVSGAGNVARHCVEMLLQRGAVVLTMSDSKGTIYARDGISQDVLSKVGFLPVWELGVPGPRECREVNDGGGGAWDRSRLGWTGPGAVDSDAKHLPPLASQRPLSHARLLAPPARPPRRQVKEIKSKHDGRLEQLTEESVEYRGDRATPWHAAADAGAFAAFPCATQGELDQRAARALAEAGVKLVVEGANMPCTPEAKLCFAERGVTFAPGKAANAGDWGRDGAWGVARLEEGGGHRRAGPCRLRVTRLPRLHGDPHMRAHTRTHTHAHTSTCARMSTFCWADSNPSGPTPPGGVAVSGLEMAQNRQLLPWTRQQVEDKLREIMHDIYRNVKTTAEEYDTDLAGGANIAGFLKVADAILAQGTA